MSFGFHSLGDFIKEDLARDDKEEKKLKALRKEKRGEKSHSRRRGNYRSFGGGYQSVRDGFSAASDRRHRGGNLATSPVAGTEARPRTRTAIWSLILIKLILFSNNN